MARELDEELRAAVEVLVDEHVRAGMSPPDARRAALIELGGIESVKVQVRDVRTGAFLDTLMQRHSLRGADSRPRSGFHADCSPVGGDRDRRHDDHLHSRQRSAAAICHRCQRPGFSWWMSCASSAAGHRVSLCSRIRNTSTFAEGRRRLRISMLTSSCWKRRAYGSDTGGAERAFVTAVSTNFFQALGIQPAAGRLFEAATASRRERVRSSSSAIGSGIVASAAIPTSSVSRSRSTDIRLLFSASRPRDLPERA